MAEDVLPWMEKRIDEWRKKVSVEKRQRCGAHGFVTVDRSHAVVRFFCPSLSFSPSPCVDDIICAAFGGANVTGIHETSLQPSCIEQVNASGIG